MRKLVAGVVAAGAVLGLAACGNNTDDADHLLFKLDRDARIVCGDRQTSTADGVTTTTCQNFTITVYETRKELEEATKDGSTDPVITGYNWQISAPDLQFARKIRAVTNGHLVDSINQGGEQQKLGSR